MPSMDLTLRQARPPRPPRPPPPDYPLPRPPDDESSTSYASPSVYARDDDDGWGSDEFTDDHDEYGVIGDAQLGKVLCNVRATVSPHLLRTGLIVY